MASTSTELQSSRALVLQTVLISLLLAAASTLLWSCRDVLRGAHSADAQGEEEEASP